MALVIAAGVQHSAAADRASEIPAVAASQGGLIVHIGCGDGRLTAVLGESDNCVVHGLDADAANVEVAREYIGRQGIYGRVSVDTFDGRHLPYVDNLVNLVVAESLGDVSTEEVLRVLAPFGVAYVDDREIVKPWPAEMDDWQQYLRDADNNAVSRDRLVGPPRRMQWVDLPAWGRSHMTTSSCTSLVSSGGRLLSIEDTGSIEQPYLPGRYELVARDAFNGIVLWRHPLKDWESITRYIKDIPVQLQRRLAAIGDNVYCTPGLDDPIALFDGATGRIVNVFDGTAGTQEFAYHEGVLYTIVGDRTKAACYDHFREEFESSSFRSGYNREIADVAQPQCELRAVDATTGKSLWTVPEQKMEGYVGGTVAVCADRVAYQTMDEVVCLDRRDGSVAWQTPHTVSPRAGKRPLPLGVEPPTLVLTPQAVYVATNAALTALSIEDGKARWTAEAAGNYHKGPDLFVTGNVVWTGQLVGYDAASGEPLHRLEQLMTQPMGHDRCYRNFITERYFINSKTGGADFVRLDGSGEFPNPWLRGTCGMGVLPANGLVYAPPYSCTCVIGTMLKNLNALSTDEDSLEDPTRPVRVPRTSRLEKGPAWGQVPETSGTEPDLAWPTYRHDVARSGTTAAAGPAMLESRWKTKLTTVPSALTVAAGKLFAADVDANAVVALDVADGTELWRFVAGGRVDSPPTFHEGLLLFGCRNGWVYCVAADDGRLVWRYKDLPDRTVCAFGRLESAWPAFGSVLVKADAQGEPTAYFTAGRSSFLDGGIFVYGLNPGTGEVVYRRQMSAEVDERGFPVLRKNKNIRGFKGDILLADDDQIYCRHRPFALDLTPLELADVTTPHIVCSAGFLDQWPQHRTYWTVDTDVHYAFASPYRPEWAGDPNPQGDILVTDGADFYEVRGFPPARHSLFDSRAGYTLFAGTLGPAAAGQDPKAVRRGQPKQQRTSKTSGSTKRWSTTIPLSGKAIAKAADAIFVAGTPVRLSDSSPGAYEAAYAGSMGGLLWAASAVDGRKLASCKLGAAPVWDGIAVAGRRLYVAQKDGSVECFGE